jgi:hypothetical protein
LSDRDIEDCEYADEDEDEESGSTDQMQTTPSTAPYTFTSLIIEVTMVQQTKLNSNIGESGRIIYGAQYQAAF